MICAAICIFVVALTGAALAHIAAATNASDANTLFMAMGSRTPTPMVVPRQECAHHDCLVYLAPRWSRRAAARAEVEVGSLRQPPARPPAATAFVPSGRRAGGNRVGTGPTGRTGARRAQTTTRVAMARSSHRREGSPLVPFA